MNQWKLPVRPLRLYKRKLDGTCLLVTNTNPPRGMGALNKEKRKRKKKKMNPEPGF